MYKFVGVLGETFQVVGDQFSQHLGVVAASHEKLKLGN